MNTDEIVIFRENRPDVPPYDRMAKARLRARLLNEPAAPVASVRRRRVLVGGVLAGAVAAVGGIVVVQGEGPAGGGETVALRQVSGPEDLAHNAALVAASEKLPPTRWAYLKTIFAQTTEGGGSPVFGRPEKTRTQEFWRRTDDKQFAVIEQGRLRVVNGSKTIPNGVTPMDYPHLLSLPTRPEALLAQVYKVVDAEYARRLAEWQKPIPKNLPKRTREKYAEAKKSKPVPPTAEERNARAFEILTAYMRDAVLPRKIQASLYGAMAKIPGVGYEGKANDLAKRAGVTLYRVEDGYLRREIFVDRTTYAYLGFRVIAVKDHREAGLRPVRQGEIIGWGALARGLFVSKPGDRS